MLSLLGRASKAAGRLTERQPLMTCFEAFTAVIMHSASGPPESAYTPRPATPETPKAGPLEKGTRESPISSPCAAQSAATREEEALTAWVFGFAAVSSSGGLKGLCTRQQLGAI